MKSFIFILLHELRLVLLWAGSLLNITAEYSEKTIHLKWMVPLQDQCKEFKTFMIEWNNIQKPEQCHGQQLIKVQAVIKGACVRD